MHLSSKTAAAVPSFPRAQIQSLGSNKTKWKVETGKGKTYHRYCTDPCLWECTSDIYVFPTEARFTHGSNSEMHHLLEMINSYSLLPQIPWFSPPSCKLFKYSFLLAANKHLVLTISNTNERIFFFPQLEPWNVHYLSCWLGKTREANILCSPIFHLLQTSASP